MDGVMGGDFEVRYREGNDWGTGMDGSSPMRV